MATEKWCYVNGQKRRLPLTVDEAKRSGWYKGIEFENAWLSRSHWERTVKIEEWCRETFERHDYSIFASAIYFHSEEDAMLCTLRWS